MNTYTRRLIILIMMIFSLAGYGNVFAERSTSDSEKIYTAKQYFAQINDADAYIAEFVYAKTILGYISDGVTTWKELGFTEQDVANRVRNAKVRAAKRLFVQMNNRDVYMAESVHAAIIRKYVAQGETTWKELGFTEQDVANRVRNAKVRAAKRSFVQMNYADAYTANSIYAKTILGYISDGVTTWKELGFTEPEVTERARLARVREVKRYFDGMNNPTFNANTVENTYAASIRAYVAKGITWKELGFTESEVTERARLAKVREAKQYFAQMNNPTFSVRMIEGVYAATIRKYVDEGETTWKELGFTEQDIANRVRKAKERESKIM
jgi:hypothetical protein